MTRWLGLPGKVALAWLVCACSQPNLKKSSVSKGFPGHDPPPLAELIAQAKAEAAPLEPPEPYAPRKVEVPPLAPSFGHALPKAPSGKPLLSEVGGIQLAIDDSLSDPITAKATCLMLAADCIQRKDMPNGRNMDSCMFSVPTCPNNHPWDKTSACCSSACKQLYEALRKGGGYSMDDAFDRMGGTDCFPSMREFMEAARQQDAKEGAKR